VSGEEPTRRATAGAAKTTPRAELKPTILVPTPAQLAAGIRLVDADESQWPRPVALMVRKAQAAGWETRVTYSQVLDIPAVAGKYKGQQVIKHFLAVRMFHVKRQIRAYGIWKGVEDQGWSADCAQAMLINHWPTTAFGVEDLGRLVTGAMEIKGVPGGFALQAVTPA
jgi:hypothetical protein